MNRATKSSVSSGAILKFSCYSLVIVAALLVAPMASANHEPEPQGWASVSSPTSNNLLGVNGDVAVGSSGTILEYNGTAWVSVSSPYSGSLNAVWGGVIVGQSGTILEKVNGTWQSVSSPTTQTLYGLDDGVAVGHNGVILEKSGGTWQTVSSPTTAILRGTDGSHAVGLGGIILEKTGGSWVLDQDEFPAFYDVDEGFLVGQAGQVWQLSGGAWAKVRDGPNDLYGISGTYAVGNNGEAIELTEDGWVNMPSPTGNRLTAVSEKWAVGHSGTILELVPCNGSTGTGQSGDPTYSFDDDNDTVTETTPMRHTRSGSTNCNNGFYGTTFYSETTEPCDGERAVTPFGAPQETDSDGDGVSSVTQYGKQERVQSTNCPNEQYGEPVVILMTGDPDDSDPNTPVPPVPTNLCADQAGTTQEIPTGNTRDVDNDGDGVPERQYQTQTYSLDAECNLIPTAQTQWVGTGAPDPDDNDPNVPVQQPGAPCQDVNGTTQSEPTGNVEQRDEDGDEVPRTWAEFQDYTINADCSRTPSGSPYYVDQGGPDPDDNDPLNPIATVSPPALAGFEINRNVLNIQVSHAQCAGDKVAFSIGIEGDESDPGFELTLYILDDDGDEVYNRTYQQLIAAVPDLLYIHEDEFNPATYTALVTAVVPQPISGNAEYFDHEAFNVPMWGCEGFLAADRLALRDEIRADLLDILDDLNFTSIELQDHRDDSLEVMGMDFNGIGFDGTIFFLFWIALLILGLVRGWVLPSLFATWGAVNEAYLQVFPFSATVLFFVLALWLEAIARRKIFKEQVRADVDA